MTLSVNVDLSKLPEDFSVEDILEELFCDSLRSKEIREDIARWCAQNIEQQLMKKAYEESL